MFHIRGLRMCNIRGTILHTLPKNLNKGLLDVHVAL